MLNSRNYVSSDSFVLKLESLHGWGLFLNFRHFLLEIYQKLNVCNLLYHNLLLFVYTILL